MGFEQIFRTLVHVSSPPPGSVNVCFGAAVEGPGGRWIPCASAVANGAYVPCIYEVGPGQRQVCGDSSPSASEHEALSRAMDLAATAAA